MASTENQEGELQCSMVTASDSGNNFMKKNSNIELPLSSCNVSGTMITALTHCPLESAQQPYEVDTRVFPSYRWRD